MARHPGPREPRRGLQGVRRARPVPDQLDEDLARATGRAFVRVVGADTRRGRPRHAAQLARHGRRVRRRRRRGRRRRGADRAGLDRPALLRLRPPRPSPARCSPRATTRRSTTASRCAAPAPQPIGMETGLAEIRDAVAAGAAPAARRGRARSASHDVLEAYAAHLLVAGPGRRPPAQGRRRRRQRDGRPHRARGVRPPRRRPVELVPMYFELDGTFPNHEANPIEPDNLVDLQARVRRGGRRHRAGLRRRRRPLLPRRRARPSRSRRRR